MSTEHYKLPDLISGYELKYDIAVVVGLGETVENLVTNPSVEFDTTGWTAIGASVLARSATYQRRGGYSLRVTPTVAINDGAYTEFISEGVYWHSTGIDVHLPAGYEYEFYIADNVGTRISPLQIVKGTGYWERLYMVYMDTAADTRRICVAKHNHASILPFYLDGALAVQSEYEITYFDGDTVSTVATRHDFYWNGAAHGSTSTMRAQTRKAGRLVRLSDYGFRLTAIVGLGMGGFTNISTPLAQYGGEEYQQAQAQARSFDLVGRVYAQNSQQLLAQRRELQRIINPHGAPIDQQIEIQITPMDDCGNAAGDVAVITCQYEGGLDGNISGNYGEEIDMRFRIFLPYIERDGSGGGAALDVRLDSITDVNSVMSFVDGVWDTLVAGVDDDARAAVIGPDGNYYFGGDFLNSLSGVAMAHVGMYNPRTDVWSPLDTGLDDIVRGLAFDAAGNLIAVGDFHNSGVNPMTHVALWNGANWADIGGGVDDIAEAVTVLTDGRYLVGGRFLNCGGGVAADRLATWDGAAWAEYGGGADNTVYALHVKTGGHVIAGGTFHTLDATTVAHIGEYDGTSWDTMNGGVNAEVNCLAENSSGMIFAGGAFTTAGTPATTVNYIAMWNGSTWYALGTGMNTPPVASIAIDNKNTIWVSGNFLTAGPLNLPCCIARWNGSAWVYVAMIPTGPDIYIRRVYAKNDTVLLTSAITTDPIRTEDITIVASGGENKPLFRIDYSAGTTIANVYQIINYTTEDNLYFNLQMMPGEIVTIDTEHATITSNFRGNVISTLLPGSNLSTFNLAPGNNRIGVFIHTTAGGMPLPDAVIWWNDHLSSLDEIVYP